MRLSPEMDGQEVFLVIDRRSDRPVPLYARDCGHEFFYTSASRARNAAFDGRLKTDRYRVKRYRLRLELIEEDAEPQLAIPEEPKLSDHMTFEEVRDAIIVEAFDEAQEGEDG